MRNSLIATPSVMMTVTTTMTTTRLADDLGADELAGEVPRQAGR